MKKQIKTETEWKKKLTASQFKVLRQKGTELPFTGKLLYNKKQGKYFCAACKAPLFSSKTKYNSYSGWPSFYDAIKSKMKLKKDKTLGMERAEVLCRNCSSHLGHVFNDGPKPTGKRYCINSAALNFKEEK